MKTPVLEFLYNKVATLKACNFIKKSFEKQLRLLLTCANLIFFPILSNCMSIYYVDEPWPTDF